jgi:hypothetical protein
MAARKSTRKVRRTFTLSPETDAYIKKQTRARKLGSHSAFLDQLVLEKAQEQRLADIDAEVTAYYDGLTPEQIEEDRAWGEFAGSHLVLNEEELAHARSAAGRNLVHEATHRPSGKRKASGRYRLSQRSKQSSAL